MYVFPSLKVPPIEEEFDTREICELESRSSDAEEVDLETTKEGESGTVTQTTCLDFSEAVEEGREEDVSQLQETVSKKERHKDQTLLKDSKPKRSERRYSILSRKDVQQIDSPWRCMSSKVKMTKKRSRKEAKFGKRLKQRRSSAFATLHLNMHTPHPHFKESLKVLSVLYCCHWGLYCIE